MTLLQQEKTKIFISYSHDSKEHSEKVLALSDQLIKDGLDCSLDQYEQSPGSGWPIWMAENIQKAKYVLVVCTKKYNDRLSKQAKSRKGKGVKFETLLSYQDIVENDSNNDKFIPVLFKAEDTDFIPKPLKAFQQYLIDSESGYEDLYRRLTQQPRILKPKGGKLKNLPVGVNNILVEEDEMNLNGLNKKIMKLTRIWVIAEQCHARKVKEK